MWSIHTVGRLACFSSCVLLLSGNQVYPLEERLAKHGGGLPLGTAVEGTLKNEIALEIRQLQAQAKAMGLWALGHPIEIGGQGMPFRDYIYVNEVQGRCELASAVLGTHSLQDCLMFLNHASPELKQQ